MKHNLTSCLEYYQEYPSEIDLSNYSYELLLDQYWGSHALTKMRVHDYRSLLDNFYYKSFSKFMEECLNPSSKLFGCLFRNSIVESDNLNFHRTERKADLGVDLTFSKGYTNHFCFLRATHYISKKEDLEEGIEMNASLLFEYTSAQIGIPSYQFNEFLENLTRVQHKNKLAAD